MALTQSISRCWPKYLSLWVSLTYFSRNFLSGLLSSHNEDILHRFDRGLLPSGEKGNDSGDPAAPHFLPLHQPRPHLGGQGAFGTEKSRSQRRGAFLLRMKSQLILKEQNSFKRSKRNQTDHSRSDIKEPSSRSCRLVISLLSNLLQN